MRDIAERTGLPQPYLEQILLALKGAGLVRSKRGVGGGAGGHGENGKEQMFELHGANLQRRPAASQAASPGALRRRP